MTGPVRALPLGLPGAGEGGVPRFLAIARALADDARRGRLPPGARLPGSRDLARQLGVHRNTVLAAYSELESQGYLVTEAGRGTFVARTLPDVRPRAFSPAQELAGRPPELPPYPFRGDDAALPEPPPRGALQLYGGVPDTRELPHAALARAYRRALRDDPRLLDYGSPTGDPRLRAALAGLLRATRGLPVEAEDVVITRGSQMALALAAASILGPGDSVAVEALGYPPAWRALEATGARLVPIPVDAEGIRVDELEARLARAPLRAVYVTPHHQYPTTVTLSAARRMALLELAKRARLAILEDDYDHEFHYDGRPVLPLASADTAGHVVYVGTLSKVLAPGLRIGFLVAPGAVRRAVVSRRFLLDRQGDHLGERAIASLIEDGELERHVRKMRRIYRARRDHAVALLRAELGQLFSFRTPTGGMALWAEVSPDVPVPALHETAAARGVLMQPGHLFTTGGKPTPHVRVGFGAVTEQEFRAAARVLAEAAGAVRLHCSATLRAKAAPAGRGRGRGGARGRPAPGSTRRNEAQ